MSDKKNRLVSEGKFYRKITDISATAADHIVQRVEWQISVTAVPPEPTFACIEWRCATGENR